MTGKRITLREAREMVLKQMEERKTRKALDLQRQWDECLSEEEVDVSDTGPVKLMNMHFDDLCTEPYDFLITRKSPVGNQFHMSFEEERRPVCEAYDIWFYEHMRYGDLPKVTEYVQQMEFALKEYGQIRLWCWCTPLPCHGETIKNYLENPSVR